MAKKHVNGRKAGGAAGIAIVEDPTEFETAAEEISHSAEEPDSTARKSARKAKADTQLDGSVGLSDVRKAAAFVNSIGGLDKAIALLQILKVAKEMQ